MTDMSLSRAGRAYVLAVVALGGGLILNSTIELVLEAATPYWVVVVALTLFSAPLSIRIPSMRATVTVTETFVFAAALLFGPAAATVTIALDGLLVSVWAKRRNLHRALFNIGEPAISIWVAAQLFYVVSGVQPLYGSPVGLGQLVVPLALLTTSYFLLNSVLSVTALWFETHANPLQFLRDQLPHTGLNFLATCSFVVLLVLNLDNLAISEFPKGRKYLTSQSFRGKSSVRPAHVGGFDVNIVILGSTAVRGHGDLVACGWPRWKLTAPWTHRTRPPHLGKRCPFSTSFHRAFPIKSPTKNTERPQNSVGKPG